MVNYTYMIPTLDDNGYYCSDETDNQRNEPYGIKLAPAALAKWGIAERHVQRTMSALSFAIFRKRHAGLIPGYKSTYTFDADNTPGSLEETIAII
jgi:hypothetical protein